MAFPGNDFWMFDSRLVVFHHYAGNGPNVDFTTSTDRHDVNCAVRPSRQRGSWQFRTLTTYLE